MGKHKHVSRLRCEEVPVDLLIALLGCVAKAGGSADGILRDAGATYRFRELKRRRNCTIAEFTRANRLCNEYLRGHILATTGCPTLNEQQFYLLAKCLAACSDLEEALRTTAAFFAMFEGRIGEAHFEVRGERVHLHINPPRREKNEAGFLVDIYGYAILQIFLGWLLDEQPIFDAVDLIYPQPARESVHLGLFDCPIRFGQPSNRFSFRSDLLSQPVVRDQASLIKLLADFPFNLMLDEEQRKLCDRVYTAMMNSYMRSHMLPTIDDVAKLFRTSTWTLRRRLTEEGTAYSSIKKKCQLNLATEFLKRSEMTIDEIADIANFSDANAFRRAFHQWTGCSPTAYRKELLAV
ncbi:AraC family transcriptional regulator [Rhizorhabdus wittichii DC-6]|nr:AraC family transcriptional regulator [Rhizorhabdus wittichii DC-6]